MYWIIVLKVNIHVLLVVTTA